MAGLWAFLGAIAGAFLAIITQVVSQWLTKRVETSARQKKEIALLKGEISDIWRHCTANLEIVENIDLERGAPLRIHLEKMKVYESSIIFSENTYRAIHERYAQEIFRLRLMIRNINLEIEFFW